MSYKTTTTSRFEREAKKLLKKYPSLKSDLKELIGQLSENPALGTPIGKDCFKIRLAITSKGKGKSGGARVITFVYFKVETIYLISIYDKSERDSISDNEIEDLIKNFNT